MMRAFALSMAVILFLSACAKAPIATPAKPIPTLEVRPTLTPSGTPTITPLPPMAACANARSGLRLRKEPNAEAEVIARIPNGECFSVYGHSADNTWFWISYRDNQGWASAQFVALQGDITLLPVVDFVAATPTPSITPTSSPSPLPTMTMTAVAPTPLPSMTAIPTTAVPTLTAIPPSAVPTKAPPTLTATPFGTPAPTSTLTPLPTATLFTMLCANTGFFLSQKVQCRIERAYCSYEPLTSGSPTFCYDAPYPSNNFTMLVYGADWSDLDGRCLIISGTVTEYRGKPEIEVTSREQIAYC